MSNNELDKLFQDYLKRLPSQLERKIHGKKNYNLFEKEISNCDEYLRMNLSFNNVKVAILLTGHIRKNSILKGIEKFCNNENVHIFIHTWDNLGLKGNETKLNDRVDKNLVINEINKYKNLKNYVIENNKTYIDSLERKTGYFNFSSPEPFIKSQLYSINKCFNIMEEYSNSENIKYDVIFKFRFDCDLDLFSLKETLINDIKNNNIIFTPNVDCKHNHMDYGTSCWACDNMYYKYGFKKVHIFEHTNIVCDLFAYGNYESMKTYCNLYSVYDSLNESFTENNLKFLPEHNENITFKNGDYVITNGVRGHLDSLYYFYCSYPERLLQKYLKDYMLIESRDIKLKLVR
jgi:hypothetical protein